MLNAIINRATAIVLRRKMDTYRRYPPSKTVLLLVDVQPAFLEEQKAVRARLSGAVTLARQAGIPIAYSSFGGPKPAYDLAPGVAGLFSWLDKASDSSDLADLAAQPADTVLPVRQSLSAFHDGALAAHLSTAGIEHVVMAGAYADLSIGSTARHSSELGYHTTVLSDCCGATSDGGHHATMAVTLPRMVHLVTTSNQWRKDVQQSSDKA
jgi:nicotinamidase-related amidase